MAKLVCPLCFTVTSLKPLRIRGKGILEKYSSEDEVRFDEVSIQAVTQYEPEQPTYGIVVCQACGKRFVAEKDLFENWSPVYPIPHRPAAKEIPEPIKGEFEEAQLCFAVKAHRGCLSMCGAALEAMWREKGTSGLQELRNKGIISEQQFLRADEVRLWGNVAKHEPMPEAVTREDAGQLLTYLEQILNAVYVEHARFIALTKKRQQLKKGS